MNTDLCAVGKPSLDASHLEDLKLAASNMLGVQRRAFEAAMALKYCGGSARQGELVFGWNRHTIELGLAEKRTGVVCLGAQEAFCGNKRWEEKQPEVARPCWVWQNHMPSKIRAFAPRSGQLHLKKAQSRKSIHATSERV